MKLLWKILLLFTVLFSNQKIHGQLFTNGRFVTELITNKKNPSLVINDTFCEQESNGKVKILKIILPIGNDNESFITRKLTEKNIVVNTDFYVDINKDTIAITSYDPDVKVCNVTINDLKLNENRKQTSIKIIDNKGKEYVFPIESKVDPSFYLNSFYARIAKGNGNPKSLFLDKQKDSVELVWEGSSFDKTDYELWINDQSIEVNSAEKYTHTISKDLLKSGFNYCVLKAANESAGGRSKVLSYNFQIDKSQTVFPEVIGIYPSEYALSKNIKFPFYPGNKRFICFLKNDIDQIGGFDLNLYTVELSRNTSSPTIIGLTYEEEFSKKFKYEIYSFSDNSSFGRHSFTIRDKKSESVLYNTTYDVIPKKLFYPEDNDEDNFHQIFNRDHIVYIENPYSHSFNEYSIFFTNKSKPEKFTNENNEDIAYYHFSSQILDDPRFFRLNINHDNKMSSFVINISYIRKLNHKKDSDYYEIEFSNGRTINVYYNEIQFNELNSYLKFHGKKIKRSIF